MRMLKKLSGLLGVAALAVFTVYWFDLDSILIKKAEPLLRGMSEMKKKMAAQQNAQNG